MAHESQDGWVTFRPTPPALTELEQLGDEIAELSAHLDAASARLLELICVFDARGGWNGGFRSCAEWLSWRVGLGPGAARERVRVARALGSLRAMAEALARGELSYAKVRALTRVATPETEQRLIGVGRGGTAAHVEHIVRGWRRIDRPAEALDAQRRHTRRELYVHQDEDGTFIVRGRLEPEVGAVLVKALEAAREALYQRPRRAASADAVPDPAAEAPSPAQQRADALALIAETALHHELDPGTAGERYQVVVHLDAPVLVDPENGGNAAYEGGMRVSAETSQRLACDASRVVMQHDEAGRVARSVREPAPSRPRCAGLSTIATGGAASRVAGAASPRAITSGIGRRAGQRRCPTSPCCAGAITGPCTRRDTG